MQLGMRWACCAPTVVADACRHDELLFPNLIDHHWLHS